MIGYTRITKKMFYAKGGFANPRLVRREEGHAWAYYEKV